MYRVFSARKAEAQAAEMALARQVAEANSSKQAFLVEDLASRLAACEAKLLECTTLLEASVREEFKPFL